MANEDAWSAGWQTGSSSAQKRYAKKTGTAAPGKKSKKGDEDKKGSQDQRVFGKMFSAKPSSYAKGGKVRKGGTAKVHKGEVILTAVQAKECGGKMGKSKGRGRKRASAKSS